MYKPFLIAPLQTGKSIGLEPWLSPQDAFETLENMDVNKGVLEKRLGFSLFVQMKHGAVAQTTTPIMGIHTYLKANGNPKLLIMDNLRVNLYYVPDASVSDITGGADIFTGGNTDFFHFVNWRGVGYMVNYKDQIYQYSGSGNVAVFNYQFNDDDNSVNHLTTCKFLFIKDDRLLFLSTIEFGDAFPQRLRYTPVLQTDGLAAGGGFVDAPTSEKIISAGFVEKDLIVRCSKSLWKVKSTGNSDIPFRWDRIRTMEHSFSPYSGIEFEQGFTTIGINHIDFFDGFQIRHIELGQLRDIIDDFSIAGLKYSYSFHQEESDHILFTYVNNGSSVPDRLLDYNFLEKNWTVHKSEQTFFPHSLGGFTDQSVPTMADWDLVHTGSTDALGSDMDTAPIDILGTPSPFTLIGCRNSKVYKWRDGEFDGTNDDNGKIAIQALSSNWNPFTKEGRKVACEKVGFLVDNDANASFLVSMFKNTKPLSTVIGSDKNEYKCILAHTSAAATRPVTGVSYATYWEATGGTGAAETWVTATIYSAPYKTKLISCDSADDTVDKFWVWIFCDGEIGDFHRLKVSHTEKNNTPKIHAFMPFFDLAGRLDL